MKTICVALIALVLMTAFVSGQIGYGARGSRLGRRFDGNGRRFDGIGRRFDGIGRRSDRIGGHGINVVRQGSRTGRYCDDSDCYSYRSQYCYNRHQRTFYLHTYRCYCYCNNRYPTGSVRY